MTGRLRPTKEAGALQRTCSKFQEPVYNEIVEGSEQDVLASDAEAIEEQFQPPYIPKRFLR